MQEGSEGLHSTSRLLPGEQNDLGSHYYEDAVHWRRVYEELLTAKVRMVTELLESIAQLGSSDARRELETTDLPILEAQAERYERRHSFWRQREWELQAAAMTEVEPPRSRGQDDDHQLAFAAEVPAGWRRTVLALIPGFLDGEDPDSTDLVDATKWAGAYQRLIAVEREVLDRALELASQLDDTSRRAVESSNVTPLRDLIGLFEQRAAYWQSHLDAARGT